MTATADCCRLLLLRLNMDGWAVGRTKVFLKYYHVEYLAKVYDKQVRGVWIVGWVVWICGLWSVDGARGCGVWMEHVYCIL